MQTTLTINKPKTYTCMDCGGRFKFSINNLAVMPKYCPYCSKSKTKK